MIDGMITTGVNAVKWQGFRGGDTGVIVFYESDQNSELPLRKIPVKKGVIPLMDPNYETLTYGLYNCENTKLRNSFVKKKYGYVFFMTKYQGTETKLEGKILVTGYYKISLSADVQKLHLRHLEQNNCQNDRKCLALRASEAVFVSQKDAFVLTPAVLKSFEYDKKVTRMTKIILDEEMTKKVLKKLQSKENIIAQYVEETHDLMPELA